MEKGLIPSTKSTKPKTRISSINIPKVNIRRLFAYFLLLYIAFCLITLTSLFFMVCSSDSLYGVNEMSSIWFKLSNEDKIYKYVYDGMTSYYLKIFKSPIIWDWWYAFSFKRVDEVISVEQVNTINNEALSRNLKIDRSVTYSGDTIQTIENTKNSKGNYIFSADPIQPVNLYPFVAIMYLVLFVYLGLCIYPYVKYIVPYQKKEGNNFLLGTVLFVLCFLMPLFVFSILGLMVMTDILTYYDNLTDEYSKAKLANKLKEDFKIDIEFLKALRGIFVTFAIIIIAYLVFVK